VAFEQNLGSRNTGALEYSLESNLGRVPPDSTEGGSYSLTHFGSLQWTRVLTPRSGLLLEAGGSYTPDPVEAGLEREGSFYGGLGYSRMVKRSRLYLFARREVVPAFGIGFSRLENRFGLDAFVPFGRAWTLRLAGIHVVPETPEGAPATYASPDEAFVSLGRRLGRRFEILSEARYRRRSSTATIPAIDTFRAGVFVSLVSPNERSDAGAFRR
jgi:hypothetical protein